MASACTPWWRSSAGAPVWYLPALAVLTLLSVAPVVAAFLAIHRRALPWMLLLAAAPPMAADLLRRAVL